MSERRGAVVLLAHGSRDPQWREPFERLRRLLADRLADAFVELAFLELAEPGFDEAVARIAALGKRRVSVVPLFLARGRHVREDIAALVARAGERFPELEFRELPALGEAPALLDAVAAWIAERA
ncbi:MAG TPA: CbiX/SirB N-terminal domain-containing protein [Burkholderiales bacterium]|nr:CbiX/SirB N-terminal domain-containing protein [Burkholderiales bacterium]